jgi:hypothetical protein
MLHRRSLVSVAAASLLLPGCATAGTSGPWQVLAEFEERLRLGTNLDSLLIPTSYTAEALSEFRRTYGNGQFSPLTVALGKTESDSIFGVDVDGKLNGVAAKRSFWLQRVDGHWLVGLDGLK